MLKQLVTSSMIGHHPHHEGEGPTKFDFGRYSTFEDVPRSLVVTGDSKSGAIVLWHHDSHSSLKVEASGE